MISSRRNSNIERKGRIRQRQAEDGLTRRVEAGHDTILVRGALGIGKSFRCKRAISRSAEKGAESWFGLFLGWKEAPLRRSTEILLPDDDSTWIDLSDPECTETVLPGSLSVGALLGPPRHMRRELLELCSAQGSHLVVIIDKYDSIARMQLDEADYGTLLELQNAGAQLLLEVRQETFRLRRDNKLEYQLLDPWRKFFIPSPSLWEATEIARNLVRQENWLIDTIESDRLEQRLIGGMVDRCGNHPGTITALLRVAKELSTTAETSRSLLREELSFLTQAGEATEFTEYLEQRWKSLGRAEREVLVALAIREETGDSFEELRRLWATTVGRNDVNQHEDRELLRRLELEHGLVTYRASGGSNICGDLVLAFILKREQAAVMLAGIGRDVWSAQFFDWTWFLVCWMASVLSYFALNVATSVAQLEIPAWGWILCWTPPSAYVGWSLGSWILRRLKHG